MPLVETTEMQKTRSQKELNVLFEAHMKAVNKTMLETNRQMFLAGFFERDDVPLLPRTAAAPCMRQTFEPDSLFQNTDEDTEETLSYDVPSSSEEELVFELDSCKEQEEKRPLSNEQNQVSEEDEASSEPSDGEDLMDNSPDESVSFESDVEDYEFIDDRDL